MDTFRQRLLVLTGLTLLACSERRPEGNTPKLPSQIVEGFRMVETNQGKRVYSLVADSAYLYGDERQIEVFHPRIEFFNESGARFSTLVANRGTVYTNTSDLTARSEVIVNTQDSTLLFTDSLRWLNSEKKVVTDSWVKIHTKEGEIEGRGLVSDAQLKKIEILEKITGTSPYRFGP